VTAGRQRAVFLDRDGTIIEDVDYLTDPEEVRVLPGVVGALRDLRAAGFLLIVVTNQSAVARGWLTEERLGAVHAELDRRLACGGARVDAYYYCPHLPDGSVPRYAVECACRKPAPGMLEAAAREHNVDLRRSYMVGDSVRDVEAGRRAGCRPILVGEAQCEACERASDLAGAAQTILAGR
jgi:D-glycero-D-manno-heptose 1,7-bisphosphate phosphatase